MKQRILPFFLVLHFSFFAQKTTFYKDQNLYKEVSEKRAKYKKIEFTDKDTTITHKIQIAGAVLLKETKKHNGKPTGTWKTYDSLGILKSKRNFNTLVYSRDPIEFEWMTGTYDEDSKNFKKASFQNGNEDLHKFITENI